MGKIPLKFIDTIIVFLGGVFDLLTYFFGVIGAYICIGTLIGIIAVGIIFYFSK